MNQAHKDMDDVTEWSAVHPFIPAPWKLTEADLDAAIKDKSFVPWCSGNCNQGRSPCDCRVIDRMAEQYDEEDQSKSADLEAVAFLLSGFVVIGLLIAAVVFVAGWLL